MRSPPARITDELTIRAAPLGKNLKSQIEPFIAPASLFYEIVSLNVSPVPTVPVSPSATVPPVMLPPTYLPTLVPVQTATASVPTSVWELSLEPAAGVTSAAPGASVYSNVSNAHTASSYLPSPIKGVKLEEIEDPDAPKPWPPGSERPAGNHFDISDPLEVHEVYVTRKYKPVAQRIVPVKTTLPEEFRMVRRKHPDPLGDLPELPTHPPEFTPGLRYTQERFESNDVNPDGFLWPDEVRLAHHVIKVQEDALAWTEQEKGRFGDEWFDPVLIPTIEHVPWALKNLPIPPGNYDKIVEIIRDKIAAGVYEDSNSSYRSRWFCVLKKDGKALRIVHDLRPLNQVTVQDVAVPPLTEQYAEGFAARACYGLLDLFVSFDQRTLDERCRDLTTFQTPLGTKRLTSVPMGYTNATQIMHGDVSFILQDEIPHVTVPFIDDVPIKGPASRYQHPDGTYETIPQNPGIRRFVWEHLNSLNRVLQRMKKVGGTFNGKKLTVIAPSVIIVGHRCCLEGRVADESDRQRIKDWPPCKNVHDIRAFLGTCGVVRIFVKNFAHHSRPLVNLTRKDTPFEFGPLQQSAMNKLKQAIIT